MYKMDRANCSLKVTQEIKDQLDALKIHAREPYYEVIQRLLNYPEIQELTSNKKK